MKGSVAFQPPNILRHATRCDWAQRSMDSPRPSGLAGAWQIVAGANRIR